MRMPMLKRLWHQRLPEPEPSELVSLTSGGSGGRSPIQPWWMWLSAMPCELLHAPGRGEGSRP
jgi:hypothetical protein